MAKKKEAFFQVFARTGPIDGSPHPDFPDQLAKLLYRKGYTVFWDGSTTNGLPDKIMVGSSFPDKNVKGDFHQIAAKLGGNCYVSGDFFCRLSPYRKRGAPFKQA